MRILPWPCFWGTCTRLRMTIHQPQSARPHAVNCYSSPPAHLHTRQQQAYPLHKHSVMNVLRKWVIHIHTQKSKKTLSSRTNNTAKCHWREVCTRKYEDQGFKRESGLKLGYFARDVVSKLFTCESGLSSFTVTGPDSPIFKQKFSLSSYVGQFLGNPFQSKSFSQAIQSQLIHFYDNPVSTHQHSNTIQSQLTHSLRQSSFSSSTF